MSRVDHGASLSSTLICEIGVPSNNNASFNGTFYGSFISCCSLSCLLAALSNSSVFWCNKNTLILACINDIMSHIASFLQALEDNVLYRPWLHCVWSESPLRGTI